MQKETKILAILTILALCSTSFADELHVPSQYPTIQAGIDAASEGDTVIVADGVHTGEGNRDIDFLGKAITVRSQSGPENCIIDCNGSEPEPHCGFYFHNDEGPNSVLDGFTITDGYAVKYAPGGAIRCVSASPKITNCTITGNTSERGGGIYFSQSDPRVHNCTINANKSIYYGSAIYSRKAHTVAITGCAISGNSSERDDGAIYCIDSNTVTITDCTITGNKATEGGGIRCLTSSVTITNCTISGNSARYGGGAAYYSCPNVVIANCSIIENLGHRGGGIYSSASSLTIINSAISGNSGLDRDSQAGGIYCLDGSLTIKNSIVTNNSADNFGGIYSSRADTTITNCTIADNYLTDLYIGKSGGLGALYCKNLTVTNSILWANEPTGAPQIYTYQTSTFVTFTNIQGGSEGEGNIDVDPRFALPSDYHLMPDSPCIDAGTNDPCGGLPPADADGGARPLDGNGDAYAVADMGAYEYNSNSACIALSPRTLYFTQNWPRPDPQTLLIRNCGGQALNWQIVEDCPWLEAEPASGQSTGEIDQVTIIVDSNGLTQGYNCCSVTVEDPQASNSPVMVTVSTHLGTILRVPSQDLPTIQAGIDAAEDHDIVLVADATYSGDGNRDLDFKGKPITVCSENGPENCIIDCNGTEDDPHRAFYFFDGQKQDALVDGFTITNGYAQLGGAISCEQSSPTINNCIIAGNAAQTGGGIYCEQASPTITNCIISSNSASYQSGAIFWWDRSSPTIKNCILHQNSAKYSGAICCASGKVQISNCIFTDNTAVGWGGAVRSWSYTICKITNCTFAGNSAHSGGAIFLDNSSSTLANCTITGNTAKKACGGIYSYYSDLRITNCILWDNLPPQLAIRGTSSVTYSNLQGGREGVLVLSDSELNWGPGNIDSDPWFVEPGFWDANGTPQDANDDFWADGDYRLLAGSPCIDAGHPNYIPELHGIIDLHGNFRLLDGNGDGITVVDMGAYEYIPPVEAAMHLAPQTLNCRSKGKWLKAHFVLVEGFSSGDVDTCTPAWIEPLGIESQYINVFGNKDAVVKIEIGFDRAEVCAGLDSGPIELTVVGSLRSGRDFYGTDTIRIISR